MYTGGLTASHPGVFQSLGGGAQVQHPALKLVKINDRQKYTATGFCSGVWGQIRNDMS